jgi:hypothetical protein
MVSLKDSDAMYAFQKVDKKQLSLPVAVVGQ